VEVGVRVSTIGCSSVGGADSSTSTEISTRSREKNPPMPPWRTFSAPVMRASVPSSLRTLDRAASKVGPSNCRVVKVHHSDRLELQLGAELRVREHRQS